MSLEVIKPNLNEIADAAIEKISGRKNPFDKITLVFHSSKIAQWFKAYFLKTKEDILMSVEFETLSSFINNILTKDCPKKHILTAPEYREYVIKALLELTTLPYEKYYKDGKTINGINLYEFSDKFSTILFNIEFDNEDISGWQKDIYDKANEFAKKDFCFTPKCGYEAIKNNLPKVDGDVYVINNSYISKLYEGILNNYNNITIFSLNDEKVENKIELYSAPSKIREIEWLHSDICKKILLDRTLRVNDFVVYAPNINDYANIIHRVFQKNTPGFPDVPFRIIGECKEKHDIISALQTLYEIANKGYFTRYDLLKFLKNPMFMFIKDFDNKDAKAFIDAIEKTNTHRNKPDDTTPIDDWKYIKKRLLSSIVANGIVTLKGGKSMTYSTIDMDVEHINKLVDIIDELYAWSDFFANKKADISTVILNTSDIKKIKTLLDNLLSSKNQYEEEKNYLYVDVSKEVEKIKNLFADVEIPATTFLLLLKDAPNYYSSSPADVFAGGVTFLSLDIDNIISEKYVYVLGLSSNNFPRVEEKNEIDFSNDHTYTYELDKKAFENSRKNAENVIVSFVNCDLKTGEEFFPSTVIPSIIRDDYNRDKDTHRIPLDESRKWDELFTYRELINKQRICNIGGENEKPAKPATYSKDNPIITTSQIKQYLENTIVYKYKQLLKDSNEDDEKVRTGEYEPIDLDGLEQYSLIKEIILKGKELADNGNTTTFADLKNALFENKFKLENRLPNQTEEAHFNHCYDLANPVIEILKTGFEKALEAPNDKLDMGGWALQVNTLCFVKEETTAEGENKLTFIEPREQKEDAKYFLPSYVYALAHLAKKGEESDAKKYEVTLITKKCATFEATPLEAKEKLNQIFDHMVDLKAIKYMDIEYIVEIAGDREKAPTSVTKMLEHIGNKNYNGGHKSYKYFNDQKMLDDKDFGYANPDDIQDDMFNEYKNHLKLILY